MEREGCGEAMEAEEQIMIMLDGLDENEEGQDLLEQLVAEPEPAKKESVSYDYQPAPVMTPEVPMEAESGETT